MKVLHINNYDRRGGAESVFNLTRSNLSENKNFSGFVKSKDSSEIPNISFYSWENDNKILGIINYIFSIKNYKLLNKFLEQNEIDVIHLHGFYASISPSVLLAIKKQKSRRKIEVIQTMHDYHLICPNASLYNYSVNEICEKCIGKKSKLYIFKDNCDRRGRLHSFVKGVRSIVANYVLGHKQIVDHFISPSQFLKNKLLLDGIPEQKIHLIRNTVEINYSYYPNHKENIIVYFGRFSKEKNLLFMVEAFSSWQKNSGRNFKLILIGNGEDERSIKQYISTNGLSEIVLIKGFMPKEKLYEEVKTAKYFCMTSSWYENSPVSIIEALVLGLIPIVPQLGGMEENIKLAGNIGYTYRPDDQESFITGLNYLESNYSELAKKLTSEKEKILNIFSLQKYLGSINKLYRQ